MTASSLTSDAQVNNLEIKKQKIIMFSAKTLPWITGIVYWELKLKINEFATLTASVNLSPVIKFKRM